MVGEVEDDGLGGKKLELMNHNGRTSGLTDHVLIWRIRDHSLFCETQCSFSFSSLVITNDE